MDIRECRPKDIPLVAEIFRDAFSRSVDRLVPGPGPSNQVFEDIFILVLQVFPQDFFVATVQGRVLGYIIVPMGVKRL